MPNQFQTDFTLCIYDGREHELKLVIDYEVVPARRATWNEPGYGDTVQMGEIRATTKYGANWKVDGWLYSVITADYKLEESILQAWRDAKSSDAEHHAELRRDERRTAA